MLRAPFAHALRIFDARQNIRHDFRLRFRALRAAMVETHAHRASLHITTADDTASCGRGFFLRPQSSP